MVDKMRWLGGYRQADWRQDQLGQLPQTREGANRLSRDPDREHPAIDVETVRAMARAGGGCLALGAGHVRLDDEARVLEAAAKAKVAVVGVGDQP